MREEVKNWWKQALSDLKNAKLNVKVGACDVAAFLSHQAAEKALKALFILKKHRLWKTHDLVGLASRMDAPEDILKVCDELNPHYIATRYPVEVEYNEEIAKTTLKKAKKVLEWAEKSIGKNE